MNISVDMQLIGAIPSIILDENIGRNLYCVAKEIQLYSGKK